MKFKSEIKDTADNVLYSQNVGDIIENNSNLLTVICVEFNLALASLQPG